LLNWYNNKPSLSMVVHSAKLGSTSTEPISSAISEQLAVDVAACVIGVPPDIAAAIGAAGGTAVLVGVAFISLFVRYCVPCTKGKSVICKEIYFVLLPTDL
jgi:hypothetical protein